MNSDNTISRETAEEARLCHKILMAIQEHRKDTPMTVHHTLRGLLLAMEHLTDERLSDGDLLQLWRSMGERYQVSGKE